MNPADIPVGFADGKKWDGVFAFGTLRENSGAFYGTVRFLAYDGISDGKDMG